ncbi:MAG: DUF1992 domain-containing protein [Nocardioidaceae bacterium]|nr:DUF1992 domain-containing protein [Nocardioidaceae bacterium]
MPESEKRPPERPEQSARSSARGPHTGSAAAAARMAQQQTWVDLQVRRAMDRGDFDDLPGAGKPIEGLGAQHDPDWWLKQLVERERVAVLPPALQLRKDDAGLDALIDGLHIEKEVRAAVEEFNTRVLRARYTPTDGPPLITMPRDVEATVELWRERRAERRLAAGDHPQGPAPSKSPKRRWWHRGR